MALILLKTVLTVFKTKSFRYPTDSKTNLLISLENTDGKQLKVPKYLKIWF